LKFKTSDGLELFYEKSGKGIPCIYLHGGPGYWSKSFQYFSKELLEEKLEMIYFDQRGCGRSEHSPTLAYNLNRLIDDLEELRISLGIHEWYLLGHSFGGILAVNYAIRFPERTKGLILPNTTLNMIDSFGHQIKKGFEILGEETQEFPLKNLEMFMNLFYATLTKLIEKEEYFKFQFVDLDKKYIVDELDKGSKTDPNFQKFVFSLEEYFQDFTSLTNKITKPVLVIAGEHDDAVGPTHHQKFKFKNQQVRLLKSSHHPYIEDQLEFKDAILNFVEF
jgi:proline iminopeptidase